MTRDSDQEGLRESLREPQARSVIAGRNTVFKSHLAQLFDRRVEQALGDVHEVPAADQAGERLRVVGATDVTFVPL